MRATVRLAWRALYPSLLYAVLLSITMELGEWRLKPSGTNYGLALTGAAAFAVIVMEYPVYKREQARLKSDRTIRKKSDWLRLCFAGFGMCLVFNIAIIWTGINSQAYKEAEKILFSPDMWLQFLLIGLFIPFAEELIFRGLCFGRLREALSFWPAAALSALLFAYFHDNIVQGIFALFGGFLLAWEYEKHHSLKASWCVHASNNILSLFMNFGNAGQYLDNRVTWQVAGCLTGILLVLMELLRLCQREGR